MINLNLLVELCLKAVAMSSVLVLPTVFLFFLPQTSTTQFQRFPKVFYSHCNRVMIYDL